MSEFSPVLLSERIEDVLLLTLNRPKKLNALNAALNHAIGCSVRDAQENGVVVIVIAGAGGKAFSAGADMVEMSGVGPDSLPEVKPKDRLDGATEIARTPLPVIAAIDGYCYGGGARLAMECDIRLITRQSTFRWPGAEYGLVVGASSLPRIVGAAKAKEWIFTARKIEAEEALAERMVNGIRDADNLLTSALTMATHIAMNSTIAVRESKRVIDLASVSVEARLVETDINKKLRSSDEQSRLFRSATRKMTGR